MGPGAVSASSDPCLASAAMAAFCGALAAGAVMEIPWNPRRSTLRCGHFRQCGLDCCVAKTRHRCGCYFAQRLAVPMDARGSWAARFLQITLWPFPWSDPHCRLNGQAAGVKKARRGHLRALGFRPGRHARQALDRSALADRQHVAALSTGEQLAWTADLVLGVANHFI